VRADRCRKPRYPLLQLVVGEVAVADDKARRPAWQQTPGRTSCASRACRRAWSG